MQIVFPLNVTTKFLAVFASRVFKEIKSKKMSVYVCMELLLINFVKNAVFLLI